MSETIVSDNFDLEQQILRCWNMVDDVKEILADHDSGNMSTEAAFAALAANVEVYQHRFERTFRKYEDVCRGLHALRHRTEDLEEELKNRAENTKKSGKKSAQNVEKVVDQ